MKNEVCIKLSSKRKRELLEEAHKRNLLLEEYLALVILKTLKAR
jgi:hypothetical protein